jgi:hypothetical protein
MVLTLPNKEEADNISLSLDNSWNEQKKKGGSENIEEDNRDWTKVIPTRHGFGGKNSGSVETL